MTSWSQTPSQHTIEYWKAQILKDPHNAIYYFNLGVVHQKQSDFENALINYDKVILLKSKLAPVALFYKAKIFEIQGKSDLTKKSLAAIQMDEVPEKTGATILAFKNRVFAEDFKESSEANESSRDESAQATVPEEKRLSLYLDFSSGSNSNPSSLSPTSTTTINSETQNQFRAGADYMFSYSSFHDLKLNYYYSQSSYAKTSSLNYYYHDVTLPIAFYFDSYRFKLTPEYFVDDYDGSAYSTQAGGLLEVTYKYSDHYFSTLFQSNNIKNKTTTYSYLDGYQQKFQIGFEKRWALFRAGIKYYSSKYSYLDLSTLASSYQSSGLSTNISYYQNNFDLSLTGVYESKKYTKANSETSARTDSKTYASLQLGYNFSDYYRVYFEGNSTNNKSNFDTSANDRRYTQSLILAGLSFNY